MERKGEGCRRLVLVPCPFQGHINPMLQLGTVLHSTGLSITIAHTQFNSPNASNHPHFTFLPIPDNLSHRDISGGDGTALVTIMNVKCEAPLQERLAQMMEQQGKHDEIVCIIYDGIMYFAEAVANHLKLPSIVLQTGSIGAGQVFAAFPRLQAQGYIPVQARIWNAAIECLEQTSLAQLQKQYQVPFFTIGPLHKFSPGPSSSLLEEDNSCITWLDKQNYNSVIYVSLGSGASIDEKDLTEMAWGLANSKQPFLWVVRPGSIRGSEWIELLPEGFKERIGERGRIVKWAPQKEVLAHDAVGGFWSHCGWNSTLESICEGVPMICQPCFGDQTVNTRYLSHVWKVGLELERGEIERAVKRLMVDKEGEEMRQRAMELKEKAELCMREGGSSYKSLNDLVEFVLSF